MISMNVSSKKKSCSLDPSLVKLKNNKNIVFKAVYVVDKAVVIYYSK